VVLVSCPRNDKTLAPGHPKNNTVAKAPGTKTETSKWVLNVKNLISIVTAVFGGVMLAPAQSRLIWQTWKDHRPVGQVLFTNCGGVTITNNPKQWSDGGPGNVGQAHFESDVLSEAQRAAKNVIAMGGQGIVVWDIEGAPVALPGQTGNDSLVWIGDPRLLASYSPEMDAVADQMFAVFRNADLKVGVLIRQTQANVSSSYQSPYPNDQAAISDMAGKIQYAMDRWGCTIFYLDSTNSNDPAVEQALYQMFPKILIFPEHTMDGGNLLPPLQSEDQFITFSAPLTYEGQGAGPGEIALVIR
jgi:hypothetical protein